MASVRCVVPGGSAGVVIAEAEWAKDESRRERLCVTTSTITQRLRFPATVLL